MILTTLRIEWNCKGRLGFSKSRCFKLVEAGANWIGSKFIRSRKSATWPKVQGNLIRTAR